jgi:enamine deaminase RidA (YjgF/YER057c/UK114 family)
MEAKEVRRTGSAGEAIYGFAQAVRSGDTVYISGQTASTDNDTTELGDVRDQMIAAYAKITELLGSYGGDMRNVVDETLFVTDMRAAIPAAVEVRRSVYGPDFEVASTLIGVQALGHPDLMVEIKCIARL